mmetsp:Transcript_17181/g.34890  ORF Transcript_17181/g.34890 Transcript_17181/m.34890 type:complete len:237 (-) Transcript_17181:850-1560(-)
MESLTFPLLQQQRQQRGHPGSRPTSPHLICAWMSDAMKKRPSPPQHSSESARPRSPAERSPARGSQGARKAGLIHAQSSASLTPWSLVSSGGMALRAGSTSARRVSSSVVVEAMLLMAVSRSDWMLARSVVTEACSGEEDGQPHNMLTSLSSVVSIADALLPSAVAALTAEVSAEKTPESYSFSLMVTLSPETLRSTSKAVSMYGTSDVWLAMQPLTTGHKPIEPSAAPSLSLSKP